MSEFSGGASEGGPGTLWPSLTVGPVPDTAQSVLACLDPTVVVAMEAEPGWRWVRCPLCCECRYQHRGGSGKNPCILTPKCEGRVESYLELNCEVCAKAVTARRRTADTRYCSKKCEKAA